MQASGGQLPHEPTALTDLANPLQHPELSHSNLVTTLKSTVRSHSEEVHGIIEAHVPPSLEVLMLVVARVVGVPIVAVSAKELATLLVLLASLAGSNDLPCPQQVRRENKGFPPSSPTTTNNTILSSGATTSATTTNVVVRRR